MLDRPRRGNGRLRGPDFHSPKVLASSPRFHSHFFEALIGCVPVGVRKSDGRCNLNADLAAGSFPTQRRSAHYTQSPELGEPFPNSISLHAATALPALRTCNGSYTSAVTHSLCWSTASFRATATSARFFAFFPPCAASSNPQRRRSLSGPKGPRM